MCVPVGRKFHKINSVPGESAGVASSWRLYRLAQVCFIKLSTLYTVRIMLFTPDAPQLTGHGHHDIKLEKLMAWGGDTTVSTYT